MHLRFYFIDLCIAIYRDSVTTDCRCDSTNRDTFTIWCTRALFIVIMLRFIVGAPLSTGIILRYIVDVQLSIVILLRYIVDV